MLSVLVGSADEFDSVDQLRQYYFLGESDTHWSCYKINEYKEEYGNSIAWQMAESILFQNDWNVSCCYYDVIDENGETYG